MMNWADIPLLVNTRQMTGDFKDLLIQFIKEMEE